MNTTVEFIGGTLDGRLVELEDELPPRWEVPGGTAIELYNLMYIDYPGLGKRIPLYLARSLEDLTINEVQDYRRKNDFLRAVVNLGRDKGFLLSLDQNDCMIVESFDEEGARLLMSEIDRRPGL